MSKQPHPPEMRKIYDDSKLFLDTLNKSLPNNHHKEQALSCFWKMIDCANLSIITDEYYKNYGTEEATP